MAIVRSLCIAQVLAAVVACTFSVAAQAKDVSAQQAGVEYARHEVEKADILHKADLEDLKDSEKVLEQRRLAFEHQVQKVADDRKKAELSKKRLQDANEKLGKAQTILDRAWKE